MSATNGEATPQTEGQPTGEAVVEFAVDVRNLNFSYGDRQVLSGINLQLKRGSR
jgi:ABC-type transporter Mla maintaining outer membrane lipid asymmetry ATPase subunit MlaF